MFNLSINPDGSLFADQSHLVPERTLRECFIELHETTSFLMLETELSFKEKVELFFRNLIASITGFFKRVIATVLEEENHRYVSVKTNKARILGFNPKMYNHVIPIEHEKLYSPRANFNADFVIGECEAMAQKVTSSMFTDRKLDVDQVIQDLQKKITGGHTFDELGTSDHGYMGLYGYFYGESSSDNVLDKVTNKQIYETYIKSFENFSKIRKTQDRLTTLLSKIKNEILMHDKKPGDVTSYGAEYSSLSIINKTVSAILEVLISCIRVFKYHLNVQFRILNRMIHIR